MRLKKYLASVLSTVMLFTVVSVQTTEIHADEQTPTPTQTPEPVPTATPGPTAIAMYRLYNPNSGEHFYTASITEKDHLYDVGWGWEGIGWYAPSDGDPVYRVYNQNGGGEHHYTLSAGERNHLVSIGWKDEGIGWYSSTEKSFPLYRQYNWHKFSCNHNYTLDSNERSVLINTYGWKDEGIAWYAINGESQKQDDQFKYDEAVPFVTPVYYSQSDPAWANEYFGKWTLGYTGCGVTTIAMIISTRLGRNVTPHEMATVLYNAGEYNNNEARSGYAGTTGTSYRTASEYYGVPMILIHSKEQLDQCLSKGKTVSFACRTGTFFHISGATHSIVLYGYDNGRINVFDPLNHACDGNYSTSEVWANTSDATVDWDLGVVAFGF